MLTNQEEQFLDLLYQNYYESLLRYSFTLWGRRSEYWHPAEDCVQLTFEKAVLKIDILQNHESPYSWLKKTCHNITLTEKRKQINRARILRHPIPVDGQNDVADPRDAIAGWIIYEDLCDRKQLLMDRLTEQERLVYQAIYEEGLSYPEAEAKYRISDGTLRGAMQRIKRKVLKTLVDFPLLIWCVLLCSRDL